MATNKLVGDNTRKGAVKKRSQLATKTMGKKTFTKRNKEGGQFIFHPGDAVANGGEIILPFLFDVPKTSCPRFGRAALRLPLSFVRCHVFIAVR